MKSTLLRLMIGILLLTIGFGAGRLFQHAKTGYYFEVRSEEEYDFPLGTLRWSYVTETFGFQLLDPGTTIIKLDDRILYKARRTFQEYYPYAWKIEIVDKSIRWQDGEFRYHLSIEPIKESQPNGVGNADLRAP